MDMIDIVLFSPQYYVWHIMHLNYIIIIKFDRVHGTCVLVTMLVATMMKLQYCLTFFLPPSCNNFPLEDRPRFVRKVSLNELQPVLSHICDNDPLELRLHQSFNPD